MPVDSRKVFVVHGRNIRARNEMFAFPRTLRLSPLPWEEAVALTGKTAPFIGESLEAAFGNAQAVLVLFTGDDVARLQDAYLTPDDPVYERALTPQPRPNVLFEAGMALGTQPDRTILVELGSLRPFSDILGRNVIKLNNTSGKRRELIHRLEIAKCNVEIQDNQWCTVGDFNGNYIGAQATGNGLPAKTAARAASMECPCLCIVER